jgi:hypothetical protein
MDSRFRGNDEVEATAPRVESVSPPTPNPVTGLDCFQGLALNHLMEKREK